MKYLNFHLVVLSGQICCNGYLGYLVRMLRIMVIGARCIPNLNFMRPCSLLHRSAYVLRISVTSLLPKG